MKNSMSTGFCFLFLVLTLATKVAAEQADFLVTLARHGDRTPLFLMEPDLWPEGRGKLTEKGMQQCVELGRWLRSNLLGDSFPETWREGQSTHIARGIDRTLQSAYGILQGIYPGGAEPGKRQPPPVYAAPMKNDFLFSSMQLCPGFMKAVKRLEETLAWVAKKKSYGDRLQYWAALSGRPESIYFALPLADMLEVRRHHGLPFPEVLTHRDIEHLLDIHDFFFEQAGLDRPTMQLISAPFVKELLAVMRSTADCIEKRRGKNAPPCPRLTLYVASDINMLALLAALGAPRKSNVGYASHIDIQFFSASREVVPGLNGKPLNIPGCEGRCSLERWLELLEQSLPDDWDSLCGLGPEYAVGQYSAQRQKEKYPPHKGK